MYILRNDLQKFDNVGFKLCELLKQKYGEIQDIPKFNRQIPFYDHQPFSAFLLPFYLQIS